MANEPNTTIIGNITADPELRFTQSGHAVVGFTVASTPRTYRDGEWVDGDPLFMRCSAWRRLAENIAESFHKGHRVVVTGTLRQRNYETREGEKRTVVEMEVTDAGHSLMFVTSQIQRADSGGAKQEPRREKPKQDPWSMDDPLTDPPF